MGTRRQMQMGIEMQKQLCGVLGRDISDGWKEWPSPSFTPNTNTQICKLKSINCTYFFATIGNVIANQPKFAIAICHPMHKCTCAEVKECQWHTLLPKDKQGRMINCQSAWICQRHLSPLYRHLAPYTRTCTYARVICLGHWDSMWVPAITLLLFCVLWLHFDLCTLISVCFDDTMHVSIVHLLYHGCDVAWSLSSCLSNHVRACSILWECHAPTSKSLAH